MINYPDTLYHKMWKTKGARFIAANRLISMNIWSNWVIAINSMYAIILSLFSLSTFSKYIKIPNDLLSLVTIAISIIIIIVSLIENSKNYILRSENLHKCSKEIAQVYEKVVFYKAIYEDGDESALNMLRELSEEYQNIINNYSENHLNIDYRLFIARNTDEYKFMKKCYIICKYYVATYAIFILAIVMPIVIFMVLNSHLAQA